MNVDRPIQASQRCDKHGNSGDSIDQRLRNKTTARRQQLIPTFPSRPIQDSSGPGERVEHNYHDHSRDIDHRSGGSTTVTSQQMQTFPVRLHYVLAELEKDGLSHIVSWQPHGRCFVVHNRKQFVSSVLPCWFNQASYASFQRQLNIYGFKRLTTGADKGGYYHEMFLRGMEFLAHRIDRMKVKNNGRRKPASPDQEPDFYKMERIPIKKDKCLAEIQSRGQQRNSPQKILCQPNRAPRWPLVHPGMPCSLNVFDHSNPRVVDPFDGLFDDLFPNLWAFLPIGNGGEDIESRSETEYMAQLLEPVHDFEGF